MEGQDSSNQSTAKLTYFNGRGLGEGVRFMLAAAGVPFMESFVTEKEQLEKLRTDGKLTFMQLPLLEIDGLCLVQSRSIVRYLARKHGMDGKTPEEKARVDILTEGGRDFMASFDPPGFQSDEEILVKIKTKTLPRYLPIFDKILSSSSSGYLVGDSLTYADMILLEALLNTEEFLPGSLKDFPKLQEFKDKISSLPQIKAFLEGPQRKPKNTPEYVANVKRVLDM
ncbi:glutathione S-transferase A4-like [Ptychodera flava]|uniref:glutathione S-transferase A4-like n=1 Tax=Ptychodera flava TaxID=63121 RepID=UPI00396A35AC